VSETEKRQKTGGRQKGTRNRTTQATVDEVLAAFHTLGGRRWLVKVARKRPDLMIQLLARITPTETKHTIQAQYEAIVGVRVEARDPLPGEAISAPGTPAAVLPALEHDADDDADFWGATGVQLPTSTVA
jgi:hypothetical protein